MSPPCTHSFIHSFMSLFIYLFPLVDMMSLLTRRLDAV